MPTELPAARRVAVVSPHLDDAVFGCGELIAAHPGTTVITAFAGVPPAYPDVTSWDARAGFGPGDDVVAARRAEDRAALAHLGARPVWLAFPDTQYGETPTIEALAAALARAIGDVGPDLVAVPLGLFHSDHRLTGDAALRALDAFAGVRCLAYADAIYRRVPGLLDERLRTLHAGGVDVSPVGTSPGSAPVVKRRAIECYGSQLRALAIAWDGGHADALEPEQYWTLSLGAATTVAVGRDGARDGG